MALILALTALCLHGAFAASTITVNTTDDELNRDGDCSLREAIQAANTDGAVDACTAGSGDDTITLPAGTYTLALTGAGEDSNATGDLDIAGNLIIDGAGAASTIIDGGGVDRVLHILSGVSAKIDRVKITNGSNTIGGGIYNLGGALTLNNGIVSGNTAGDAGGGGGIYNNSGTVMLTNSTVSGNTADYGGGIYSYWFTAVLTLTNSTVSGNTAGDTGGGISNNRGRVTLTNSTVSGNTANRVGGGGIYSIYGTLALNNVTIADNDTHAGDGGGINSVASTVSFKNSIVAGNSDTGEETSDCSGALDSQGHNLIGNNIGCTFTPSTGDQVGTNSNPIDPQLGPLASNGGQTFTHALLGSSPAIDAGNPARPGSGDDACAAIDQRGQPRPADGNGDGIAICDVGAYEVPGQLAATPTATPLQTSTPTSALPTSTPTTTSTATPATVPTIPTVTPAATGTPASGRTYLPLVMGVVRFASKFEGRGRR